MALRRLLRGNYYINLVAVLALLAVTVLTLLAVAVLTLLRATAYIKKTTATTLPAAAATATV